MRPICSSSSPIASSIRIPRLRAPQDVLRRAGPASALWPLGISGDLPIVVLRIDETDDMEIVRQLLRAHTYWRSKLLTVDLVILNDRAASYAQDLQTVLDTLVRGHAERMGAQPGAVYLLRNDLLNAGVRELLLAAARVVLSNRRGTLAEQIETVFDDKPLTPPRARSLTAVSKPEAAPAALPKLEYANSFGGFTSDGREYAIVMEDGQLTPAPWINVIANPDFGFQVSSGGAGFTWAFNSQQNQITAWSNDPVTNESSENIYIRDLDTGEVWSPTAYPIRDRTDPLCRLSRPWLFPLRTCFPRHRHRTYSIRAHKRSGENLPPQTRQPQQAARGAFPSPPMSNGRWAPIAPNPNLSSQPRSTHSPPPCSRKIPGAKISAAASPFSICKASRQAGQATAANSSAATARRKNPQP